MKFLLLLTLLGIPASARVVTYAAKGAPSDIEDSLRAAGFKVEYTRCVNGTCALYLPDDEQKDPLPLIAAYTDPAVKAAQDKKIKADMLDELLLLQTKFSDGKETPDDVRRALYLMIEMLKMK